MTDVNRDLLGGKTPADLHNVLVTALARLSGRRAELIRDDSSLAELGIDSLTLASLFLEVEDVLGFELPLGLLARYSEVERLTVVGDLSRVLFAVDGAPVDAAAPS